MGTACLTVASLPRLGKPSDYACSFDEGYRLFNFRFAPSAWKAERLINQRKASQAARRQRYRLTLNKAHSFVNCYRLIDCRFAPSAWKAERLYSCSAFQAERAKRSIHRRKKINQRKASQSARRQSNRLTLHKAHSFVNGHRLIDCRFAPSAWKAERLINQRKASQAARR